MYASLDKVDLSFAFESGAGELHYFFAQTDHRAGLQIAEDGAFSAVFALVRCLAARACALQTGRQPFRVIYQLAGEAPAVLQYVVAAAGATLVIAEIDPERAAAVAAAHPGALYIVKPVKAGELLTRDNVRAIRPGYGLAPKHLDQLIGCRVVKDASPGTPLAWELVRAA